MEEDLKIIKDLKQELAEIKQKSKYASENEVMQSIINWRERQAQAIEHLVQAYKQQADIIKNSVSKDRIKEVLDNGFVVFYEEDADSPNWATKINRVKYINAIHLQELLEGDE